MVQRGFRASINYYVGLLKEHARTKALKDGKQVHAHIKKNGLESNIYLANTLVHMYAKCGSILHARQVFDNMPEHNMFSWTAMISAHAEQGQPEEAFYLYQQMQREGLAPDKFVFVFALKACASMRSLQRGKHIHADVVINGLESDIFIGNTLVDMYAKCNSMGDAPGVFYHIFRRDVVSWNTIITGYTNQGLGEEALTLFEQMQGEGLYPTHVTYVMVLKACASIGSLNKGKKFHAQLLESGFKLDLSVLNTLLVMYAKCGSIVSACSMFNKMYVRDVTSWNVMIAAYAEEGLVLEAFELFKQIEDTGYKSNDVTFATILKACNHLTTLEHGMKIHSQLVKRGIMLDISVSSTLIDMYVKCGSIRDAQRVFNEMSERDLISWNVIIAGCAQHGSSEEILMHFEQMLLEGLMPDKVTFIIVVKACSGLTVLKQGKHIHAHIIETVFKFDISVLNTLIDMYAKFECVNYAFEVFTKMQERDIISWNTIIALYAQQGLGDEAIIFVEKMLHEHVTPNNLTFTSMLKSYASVAALEWGKQIHHIINRTGCETDISVRSALVDMYAKCGSIKDAVQLFSGMQKRQVVSWTAMIAGCAQQGLGKEALQLFQEMQEEGIKPDKVTFGSVLSACSRAGLLEEGCCIFHSMSTHYGIKPNTEHFACMVDLLGRAGHLHKAMDVISNMPIPPDDVVWMALLDACRSHGNMELGRYAFQCVVNMEPKCLGAYVLLSNIYAAAGRWDEASEIRKVMKEAGVMKLLVEVG